MNIQAKNPIYTLVLLSTLILASCQVFYECPAAVKERKIVSAYESCSEMWEIPGDQELKDTAIRLKREAFDYMLEQTDVDEDQKNTIRNYYSNVGLDDCDRVEHILRYGIQEVARLMKEDKKGDLETLWVPLPQ
ncbi:MAG: hypothetical protein OXG24_11720 [Gammaproteobacteria bacterium]|nr:hypothetical protein [Gammaproteobacteria bacterium]